jgi:hypothetical protein
MTSLSMTYLMRAWHGKEQEDVEQLGAGSRPEGI